MGIGAKDVDERARVERIDMLREAVDGAVFLVNSPHPADAVWDELPQEVQDGLASAIPNPARLGKPEEFAALVRSMVENDYLNGEVVRLDGALRMQAK